MMDSALQNQLKDLVLEQLMKQPIGDKLQEAMKIFQSARAHFYALAEKQDEVAMTGVKAVTVMTFAILKKMAEGKKPSELATEDWKDIAAAVSEYAILQSDKAYSVFIFGLYESYIRYSASQLAGVVSQTSADAINALADELREKGVFLQKGSISEVAYTEDCLWIALEAMVKLLACTAGFGDQRVAEFTQALADYAFEYGRLMLYRRELELVNQFIAAQYRLDAELEQKYNAYLADLQKESQQFYALIDNAFAPDFREAFLQSAILARAYGVKEEEILYSTGDVDNFFLE